MARQHLQRLLTACAVLLLAAANPAVAADQLRAVPSSESQLAQPAIDDGDGVRLVDDAVRAESSDREGMASVALIPAASDPATERTGLAVGGYDSRYDRSCSAGAGPRAPPTGS